jgi:hypothetical protein
MLLKKAMLTMIPDTHLQRDKTHQAGAGAGCMLFRKEMFLMTTSTINS